MEGLITDNDKELTEILGLPDSTTRRELMTPQAAFITFQNPYAAFLAKKMSKTVKRKGIEDKDKPKIFGADLRVTKIGYPTDTQYENYGMRDLERLCLYGPAALIVVLWAYFFFSGIFRLNQMLQNRKEFFRSMEQCKAMLEEYETNQILFEENAIDDYETIMNSDYKLSWQLIADDVPTLNKLSGELSCYCDFKKGRGGPGERWVLKLF